MPARTTATITLKEGRTDLVMGVVFERDVPRLVDNPDIIEYLRHAGAYDVRIQVQEDPEEVAERERQTAKRAEAERLAELERLEAERLAAEEAERLTRERERLEAERLATEEAARLAAEAGQADPLPEGEIPSSEGDEALDVEESTDGGEATEEVEPPADEVEPKVEAEDSPAPEPVPAPVKPKAPAKGGSKSKPKKKKPKPKPKAKK